MSSHTSLITSASNGVAQVSPTAPRRSCSRAMRGDLCVLMCGLKREIVCGCVLGRPVEITGEPIEIDDGNWRLELGDRQRHVECTTHSISGDGK